MTVSEYARTSRGQTVVTKPKRRQTPVSIAHGHFVPLKSAAIITSDDRLAKADATVVPLNPGQIRCVTFNGQSLE